MGGYLKKMEKLIQKQKRWKPIKEWSGETYFYIFRMSVLSYLLGLVIYISIFEINVLLGMFVFLFIQISLITFIVTDFFYFIVLIKQKRRS